MPLLENLEATAAIRYEKFSNGLDTTNPKLAVKWQVIDWLALRGTVGTTFRCALCRQLNPAAPRRGHLDPDSSVQTAASH